MKYALLSASALSLVAGMAGAAGLDRSNQNINSIFSDPGTANLSFGFVQPSVTGKDAAGNDYDVGKSYNVPSLSWTGAINESFTYGVILDEPYGADIKYNNAPTTSALGGTAANLDSQALTLMGRYQINQNWSVHGGLSVQRITAEVALNGQAYQVGISASLLADDYNSANPGTPDVAFEDLAAITIGSAQGATPQQLLAAGAAATRITIDGNDAVLPQIEPTNAAFVVNDGYAFDMKETTSVQPIIGAAYEKPDIALRAAVTYFFETQHKSDTEEEVLGATVDGDVNFVTPQALNFDFQTGVAADTLLTASFRWVQYSAVDIVPDRLGSDLVNLDDGRRFTLGVARRFDEAWAGSVNILWEPEGDDLVSPLGPTNGLTGITIGGRYENNGLTASAGINYSLLGDADAEVGGRSAAEFENNHSTAFGISISYEF